MPFRRAENGDVEILVLTSRETQRFVIPKGWPEAAKKDWRAAAVEAMEEGGVAGKVERKPIGRYTYWKRLKGHFALVHVDVYPLKVEKHLKRWPERRRRLRRWLPARDAALLVDEPQLHSLIEAFAGAQTQSA